MLKELLSAFGIMALCVVIHVSGMVFIGEALVRRREKIEARISFTSASVLLMIVFAAIIALHVIECVIWAGFYRGGGLFPNFESALYFSLTSYSTAGYGDVVLPPNWRLLGTFEAISGALLCGLSTAFLFAIVTALFRFRGQRLGREQTHLNG